MDARPTIAIVAHYDSMGVAPRLASGVDSNGSGIVALLQLARIFSRLYASTRTRGKFNLLFVLTSGGKVNFAGARQWLSAAQHRTLDSIDFALCLDTISGASDLNLHVSRLPKRDPELARLHGSFIETAKEMDIKFKVVHKKINMSEPTVSWEHEQFSRKRVPAGTLSHMSSPRPSFSGASILDRRGNARQDILERNIEFIARSLARHMYGLNASEHKRVFGDQLGVAEGADKDFVSTWLDHLARTPRMAAYTTPTDSLLSDMEQALRAAQAITEVVRVEANVLDERVLEFYSDSGLRMSAYHVKPFTFDVVAFLAVASYLAVLYGSLFLANHGISSASVKELFGVKQSSRKQSRRSNRE